MYLTSEGCFGVVHQWVTKVASLPACLEFVEDIGLEDGIVVVSRDEPGHEKLPSAAQDG